MEIKNIAWDSKFEIGVPRIDFEHQIFADLINILATKVSAQKDAVSLSRTLREIIRYADFHFVSEENIMEEAGYPGIKEHTAIHRQLQQTLNERAMKLAAGDETPAELLRFLVDWFTHHTIVEDARISLYCKTIPAPMISPAIPT